jgi:C-terminal processing protease CtpA/Prc
MTPAYLAGPNSPNPNSYHGGVVLLVDERTQSHAEFTTMCLQTAPLATTIGSQTAGADGNVSLVWFPGGISTYFSGIGVYYPDGAETQKVGVRVDVTVHPTIAGIQAGRDEVLEKAREYLNDRFGGSADRKEER